MQRSTILNTASNRTDFDYLNLRKSDNERGYQNVQKILHNYYEQNQRVVFSEVVQKTNPRYKVTEHVICVTANAIYLLDLKCKLEERKLISDLKQIILIKKRPNIFALIFKQGIEPLIL